MKENNNLLSRTQLIEDYRVAYRSRQMSLLGQQEVMSGKAKFGIFGGGKEIAQIAMAHVFQAGDFRSGYYRDQTFMLALGAMTIQGFFAQLYAHTDLDADPASAGRMMNGHYATRSLNEDGSWRNLSQQYNSSADISPTASQMPRLVGLAYASRIYREVEELKEFSEFSRNGNEIAFGTIGNASCAEGMFWESINAIGVLKSPAIISIWDDNYGISVSNEHQILKQDLSALLSGFQREENGDGYDVYTVPGWNYPEILKIYQKATQIARESHVPAIIHVTELTQPQGHSTSGSHKRYKSADRLQWEQEYDCIAQMRAWLIEEGLATNEELTHYEEEDLHLVRTEQKAAWQAFVNSISKDRDEVIKLIENVAQESDYDLELAQITQKMSKGAVPLRQNILKAIFETLKITREEDIPAKEDLMGWRDSHKPIYQAMYSDNLWSHTAQSPLNVPEVKPIYSKDAPTITGFEILNRFFKTAFARDPQVIAFGEDVGFLGGVNQTMAGMQAKYGRFRVSDTGIRELTILGQAIGLAMRGLRPIAEIQYLDYILYALQLMSDDLATVRWRTRGGQKAPVIISTRGHRLEGVWHAGSPMGSIIHMVRGIHVLVPRDMTRAAGLYNTLLQGDDPGLVVEVLNAYRKKEVLPDNLSEIAIPLGVPETLRPGSDITLITYGAMCPIVMEAAEWLSEVDIEVEVIDVQSLLPFDLYGHILKSLQRTGRLICVDEDVPGGTSAYMMQQVLEKQGGYEWLDAKPRTLSAQAHRPAYGSDGDYFSKPNAQDVFETIYEMMYEAEPDLYPLYYKELFQTEHLYTRQAVVEQPSLPIPPESLVANPDFSPQDAIWECYSGVYSELIHYNQ